MEGAGVEDPKLRLAGGRGVEGPWQQLLAGVLGRPLQVLPRTLAAVAAARGAALLAGIASEVYRSQEDVLGLAPEPDRSVRPGDAAEHEAAYVRYRELYPGLYS